MRARRATEYLSWTGGVVEVFLPALGVLRVNFGRSDYSIGVVEKPGAEMFPLTYKFRFEVTRTTSDEYVFASSLLRNID